MYSNSNSQAVLEEPVASRSTYDCGWNRQQEEPVANVLTTMCGRHQQREEPMAGRSTGSDQGCFPWIQSGDRSREEPVATSATMPGHGPGCGSWGK